MLKRSLLLLTVLLACDETRDVIVSYRPAPISGAGSDPGGAGATSTPEADAGPNGGTLAAGGTTDVDAGSGGEPAVAGGGNGGSPPTCIQLPRKPWVAIGNPSSLSTTNPDLYNSPLQAVDNNLGTRWSTGVEQAGGEWIEIDFGHPVTLTLLELDHKADRNNDAANPDFPAELLVSMSETSRDFGAPILADVPGTEDFTMVSFAEPATGRYLLLQQIGTKTRWWSIHELNAVCDIPVPSP